MSKRHTYIESSSPIPDWVLFQENLVFYAPLNQGELFDYISGEVGATSTDAWATWDDTEQMYQLGYNTTLLGHNCTALRYTSDALKANLASTVNGRTIVMQYKDVEYSGRSWQVSRAMSMSTMKDVWETSPRMNCYIDGYRLGQFGSTPTSTAMQMKMAVVVHTATMSQRGEYRGYINGVRVATDSSSPDLMNYPLSLGICDKNGHATNTSSQYNASKHIIYAKDVRVYNRLLTDAEVQQLYNAIQ